MQLRYRNELLATSSQLHLEAFLITKMSIFPLVSSPESNFGLRVCQKTKNFQLQMQKVCDKVFPNVEIVVARHCQIHMPVSEDHLSHKILKFA